MRWKDTGVEERTFLIPIRALSSARYRILSHLEQIKFASRIPTTQTINDTYEPSNESTWNANSFDPTKQAASETGLQFRLDTTASMTGPVDMMLDYQGARLQFRTAGRVGEIKAIGHNKHAVFEEMTDVVDAIASRLRNDANKGILEQLIDLKFPEAALVGNQELLTLIRSAEETDEPSHHNPVFIKDTHGKQWLLKPSRNKLRATLESAANYVLSANGFDFIPGSRIIRPIEWNGLYLNIINRVNDVGPATLSYWIKTIATYHSSALEILQANQVTIPQLKLTSGTELQEMWLKSRKYNCIPRVNTTQVDDAVAYLESMPPQNRYLVHAGLKPGNRYSTQLLDLEHSGIFHPSIDLVMLFMSHAAPRDEWSALTMKYLEARGVKGSFDQEHKELVASFDKAALYVVSKEVIAASTNFELNNQARLFHRLLSTYLN